MKAPGGKTHPSTAAPPYLREFLFRTSGAHSGCMFCQRFYKTPVFSDGCCCLGWWGWGRSCGARAVVSGRLGCCGSPGAPVVRGLSFLVVWAVAACRALLWCAGCRFWSFGLLRLAGRSCGARAVVSGRLGCCGLPGALAVYELSFLVVWAAVACWALLQ